MARRGLTRDLILKTSVELLEEKGYHGFSLRTLAARLGVRPASLYNHVSGVDEILIEIGLYVASSVETLLRRSVEGKERDEAFLSAARAYRQYAAEHPHLYRVLIHAPRMNDESVMEAGYRSFAPLREIVLSYGLSEERSLSFLRGLRSVLHGFAELTENGFMTRGSVSRDESFDAILQDCLLILKENGNRCKEESDL